MAAVDRGSDREIVLVNRTQKIAEAAATDLHLAGEASVTGG